MRHGFSSGLSPVRLPGWGGARIGKARPDMPWIERTFDPAFRQWILDFPTAQRPQLYAQLAQYKENKQHIIFHSREESTIWLENWAKARKG